MLAERQGKPREVVVEFGLAELGRRADDAIVRMRSILGHDQKGVCAPANQLAEIGWHIARQPRRKNLAVQAARRLHHAVRERWVAEPYRLAKAVRPSVVPRGKNPGCYIDRKSTRLNPSH